MFTKKENLVFILVFLFGYLIGSNLTSSQEICESYGHCTTRDSALAMALGRRCRRLCDPRGSNHVCRNGLECKFAHECGYSCINMTKECPPPLPIPNMKRVVVYRRNQRGCYSPGVTSNYLFDDMAVYKCQDGFSLLYPSVKHYCTGRAKWSHPGHSVCIKSRCCLPQPTQNTQSSNRDESVSLGTSITFRCDRGYEIDEGTNQRVTERTVECLRNGKFSNAIPQCTEITPCKSSPCLNGGTCVKNGRHYFCLCPDYTDGRRCENVNNYCLLSPCQNGGICQETRNSYNCTCLIGFTGRNCERRVCTLTRIPTGIFIYGQTEDGFYDEGTKLQIGCADLDQQLTIIGRSITCLGGESWSPDYELLRCV